MNRVIWIFLFLTAPIARAQNTDSLWQVWNNTAAHDTARLNAMQELAWKDQLFTNPDSAFELATFQFNFAKDRGYKLHMASASRTQGAAKYLLGDHPQAIKYTGRGLEISEAIGDRQGIAKALNNLGIAYFQLGDYVQALDVYVQSMKMDEEDGNMDGVAASLNNIGQIYANQSDPLTALDYYKRALELNLEVGDQWRIGTNYLNIGALYNDLDSLEKCREYYELSLKAREAAGDTRGMAETLHNLGAHYQDIGEYEKAEEIHLKSLTVREEIQDAGGIIGSHSSFARMYHAQGMEAKADHHASLALHMAQELRLPVKLRSAARISYQIKKSLGRYKDAYEIYNLYVTTNDSIKTEDNQKALVRQLYQRAFERKSDSMQSEQARKTALAQAEIDRQEAIAKADQKREDELAAKESERKNLVIGSGAGGLVLSLIFVGFVISRLRITRQQKEIIEEQKQTVELQKLQVEEKNREILDSIQYAKRLQDAILPQDQFVKSFLPESFILYLPKDIVAGDFYWMEETGDHIYFAVADCTGHGVPGAMVSVVCSNALTKSVKEEGLTQPAKILDRTRELVIDRFQKSQSEVKDGMDISLCKLNLHSLQLEWAGANNPLWIVHPGAEELDVLKPDKQPIGTYGDQTPFRNHSLQLQSGDRLYLFSDGYPDQFGGDKGKKFKSSGLKKLILASQDQSMEAQLSTLEKTFEDWKGDTEQIDDVCLMGIEIRQSSS